MSHLGKERDAMDVEPLGFSELAETRGWSASIGPRTEGGAWVKVVWTSPIAMSLDLSLSGLVRECAEECDWPEFLEALRDDLTTGLAQVEATLAALKR